MFKTALIGLMGVAAMGFEIGVPHTEIGNSTIACNPASAPQKTNGFSTYFSDDTYACEHWNHKAKSSTACFVALNGVCGMKVGEYCDKCVEIFNVNN